MKAYLALAALASLPLSAAATTVADYCDTFADAAAATMVARQIGARPSELYQIAAESGLTFRDAANALVDSAMAPPIYASDSDKKAAVYVFGQRAFDGCLRKFW
ncbi:hypothetical protein [Paracoccus sp. (in: a-proteobacteria)]|uniref:hypothetical protein n=1 Tax=Paracoccus sp. TaxID=267 RepID=UPI00396CBB17